VLNNLGIHQYTSTQSSDSKPDKQPNIIIIYLESFQLEFTKYGKWQKKPLTPQINNYLDNFTVYTNFFNSVTPTINALITMHCGVDVFLAGVGLDHREVTKPNTVLKNDKGIMDVYGKQLECYSDVMRKNGYQQVFMKGARIDYSSTKDLLLAHGYDMALGLNELNSSNKYGDNLNEWGLQDIDLIDSAIEKLEEIKKTEPYSLTLLTVNSHLPGLYDKRCPKYSGNELYNGIHCTDYAVGKFLAYLDKNDYFKNTIIILAGDHTLFNSVSVQGSVGRDFTPNWYDRTFLAIHSPFRETAKEDAVYGITEDIAPTILELLNIDGHQFISGKSLLSERKKYQHIVASQYEIKDGKKTPDYHANAWEQCDYSDLLRTDISGHGTEFTLCQRVKMYFARQKYIHDSFEKKNTE
jgi:phosphoglycerol transferase